MTDDHGSVGKTEPRHFWRIFAIWVALSATLDPLFYFLVGPHVPPGTFTTTAEGAQFDFNVLFVLALPVMLAIWIYLAYAILAWRSKLDRPDPVGGAAAQSNRAVQATWIAVTSALVIGLFSFGTYELVEPGGAGGAQGPNPLWTPSSHTVLPIQVIAQQWKFTYRYPTFGGMETPVLYIPTDTTIAFHVTSLDVIHSFWAYQLGVKADANPAQDDIAYTTTKGPGDFTVRCSELCGIWHGAMYDYGKVLPAASFYSWAKKSEASLAALTKTLAPFSYTYVPDANGADGGYYPDNVDPYSSVEVYGAGSTSK
jgi:cytochrome c oxidase subunit II